MLPGCQCGRHERCIFDAWAGKDPWRREWQPAPVLPGENPSTEESGERATVPGGAELDTTEQVTHTHTSSMNTTEIT